MTGSGDCVDGHGVLLLEEHADRSAELPFRNINPGDPLGRLAFHVRLVPLPVQLTTRSASLMRRSPEISSGNSVSRRVARATHSSIPLSTRRKPGDTNRSKTSNNLRGGSTILEEENVLVVIVSKTDPWAACTNASTAYPSWQ